MFASAAKGISDYALVGDGEVVLASGRADDDDDHTWELKGSCDRLEVLVTNSLQRPWEWQEHSMEIGIN